jgi:hypothetical protein
MKHPVLCANAGKVERVAFSPKVKAGAESYLDFQLDGIRRGQPVNAERLNIIKSPLTQKRDRVIWRDFSDVLGSKIFSSHVFQIESILSYDLFVNENTKRLLKRWITACVVILGVIGSVVMKLIVAQNVLTVTGQCNTLSLTGR